MTLTKYVGFIFLALIADIGYDVVYLKISEQLPPFGSGDWLLMNILLKIAIPAALSAAIGRYAGVWDKTVSDRAKILAVLLCIVLPLISNVICFFAYVVFFGAYI
jgi:hypothetical protein